MKTCPKCKIKHNKSGIFCSRSCANTRIHTIETRRKIGLGVSNYSKNKSHEVYKYICDKCNSPFERSIRLRKDRNKHCLSCRRLVTKINIINISSIQQVSKRTISKILKRANIVCALCGWNQTTLDVHHIIPKSKGGTDEHNNLIACCPNCHRLAHENKITLQILQEHCLAILFQNWKEYYFG